MDITLIQGLLKKHEAFETDLVVHRGRVEEREREGMKLVSLGNYQAENINQRITGLKVSNFNCIS